MRQPPFTSGRRSDSIAPAGALAVLRSAVMMALLGTMLRSASAGTEVRGSPDALYLRAENATVAEVLTAISAKFKVKYPPSSNLDHTITGVYSGSLRHVLMRILDGSSYVLMIAGDDVEIKLLGTASSGAVALNQSAVTVPPPETAAVPPVAQAEVPRLVPK